jgi:glycosyltransferase involved in cell wall biosynthesis
MAAMPLEDTICLVVPTLNAARELAANATISQAARLVISDGGSTDGTLDVASALNAVVVEGPPGRGAQLAAGADAAIGLGAPWLLFLHADTSLAPGWRAEAEAFIFEPGNRRRAGAFRFALDDEGPKARRVVRLADWRNRVFGLPYGDQGLLISAAFYQALGGYRPLVLMEDVEIGRASCRERVWLKV